MTVPGAAGHHGEHVDAVVVGSGFGGSVMAYRLALAGQRVVVLERGRRYPPGSFPRSPHEVRESFWSPADHRYGMFQIWKFRHLDAVVASGLGGGSLIYANVLLRKDEAWFFRSELGGGRERPWPVTRAELDHHYDLAEAMLAPEPYPAGRPPYDGTPKTAAFRAAAESAGLDWFLPPLAVAFADRGADPVPGEPIHCPDGSTTDNLHGRTRTTCRLCGECDIGCNYGAKNTLDYTYLTEAARLGAELRDCCEVEDLWPLSQGGYGIRYRAHPTRPDPRGRRQAGPAATVSADRLVLAAGSIGSTHLLLRNRGNFPRLSPMLGWRCSSNGDYLGFATRARPAHAERDEILAPSRGPVITSSMRRPDVRDGGDGPGLYLQEGGYPVVLDWLVEASGVMGLSKRVLGYLDRQVAGRVSGHRRPNLSSEIARLVGSGRRSGSLLPLLAMGMDAPDGVLSLRRGRLRHSWEPKRSQPYVDRVVATMRAVTDAMGADLVIPPTARLGRIVTVHPLGGCPMGEDPADGVVDRHGQVFGYPGLVVADGAVMPGPVGANPALTIAALADRFADRLS